MDYFTTTTTGKAIRLDFSNEYLRGLNLNESVGSGCQNNQDDVEVVSWLLFFYFMDWSNTGASKSGISYIEAHNCLTAIMHNTRNLTSDHVKLIQGLQRVLNIKANGAIAPRSTELVILSTHVLPFVHILGEYNCSGKVSQIFSSLNPDADTHWMELEVAMAIFPFSETAATAAFNRIMWDKIPEPAMLIREKIISSIADNKIIGSIGRYIGETRMIKNTKLRDFFIGKKFTITMYALVGVSLYAHKQYTEHQQCMKELDQTVRRMNIDINNWKDKAKDNQKYEEELNVNAFVKT